MNTNNDTFFNDPTDARKETRDLLAEALSQLLIWMADAPTLEDRGLRVTVCLYCVRPDLINGATMEQIGYQSGRTQQHVYNLARSFRLTTGFRS
jgi:hypothetical protein